MPPKRKGYDGREEQTYAQKRRKEKRTAARTIAVQPTRAVQTSKDGKGSSSMEGLPPSIDVEKFANARAFEIQAMHDAMDNARDNATQRVWQTLPRHLRRRAASHNVRRVPERLRQKARAEMDPTRKKTQGKATPKRGKAKRITRTEELLRRQRSKTWLETHIWHAKRMRMENKWGYRLAVNTTEKSFRPSHRATLHGAILHDASYDGIIEMKGPQEALVRVLHKCCDPQGAGPGAVRYTSGSRVCEAHMYKMDRYPFDHVGPVTIIWKPPTPDPPVSSKKKKTKSKEGKTTDLKGKGKADAPHSVSQAGANESANDQGKGKSKSSETSDQGSKTAPGRVLWIRCHALLYEEAFSALYDAVAAVMAEINDQPQPLNKEPPVAIEMTDLRNQFNIFDFMGPKSSQVIKGALSPINGDNRPEFRAFWNALGKLQSPGVVPRGMVVGMNVYDPRLNFPPKNAKVKEGDATPSGPALGLWPEASLAASNIWNEETRSQISTPKFKKSDLDKRREKNLVPGTKLKALRQDDRVPLLLIQRGLNPRPSVLKAQETGSENRPLYGWTLIFPRGWGMSFLMSLIYTGSRVGGLRERETQSFEAGCAFYPNDYPDTSGYAKEVELKGKEEQAKWERTPPAKRPNWKRLGTESPLSADSWTKILDPLAFADVADETDLIPAQRSDEKPVVDNAMDVDQLQTAHSNPWVLRGPDTMNIVNKLSLVPADQRASCLREILYDTRNKRKLSVLEVPEDSILQYALVTIKISPIHRGAPHDDAHLYMLSDEEIDKWKGILEVGSHSAEETSLAEEKTTGKVVGYATSGDYSLSLGRGHSIGSMPLTHYLDLLEQNKRLSYLTSPFMLTRNKDSTTYRPAYVQILVS